MSAVDVVWLLVASCALLLSLAYGLVWVMDRKQLASLAFAGLGLSIVLAVILELYLMRAPSVQAWGEGVRWTQVPILLRITATIVFIRLYFGTGIAWLGWTVIAIRAFILVAGFVVEPNFNFARIDSIDHVSFLGEQVTVVGHAIPGRWQLLGTTASLLAAVFVADASIKLWRKGGRDARRKALLIGGGTFISVALGSFYAQIMIWYGAKVPVLLAPPYLIMFFAMTFELSRDTLRASRLARELQGSEARLEVAASAAGLGLWTFDSRSDRLWATSRARQMLGFEAGSDDSVDVERLRRSLDATDLARIREVWRHAAETGTEEEVLFRIRLPDGSLRWISARGRSEQDAEGNVTVVQGVLRDVTEQQLAREENEQLRNELAHVGRVSVLGTLSSSLAHELSQPLGAIMLNTEAAELLLAKPDPNLEELRAILADIHRDDQRAAEVIERMRALLKRRELDFAPVPVEGLLRDMAALLKSDAIARHVKLEFVSATSVPDVRGDKVQLSQVLLNLAINAMDAVAELEAPRRYVSLAAYRADAGWVEFAVADAGLGISAEAMPRIFEPFYTTKALGMGMGLSVSRTIVEAHGGKLWAENLPTGGAVFKILLPAME